MPSCELHLILIPCCGNGFPKAIGLPRLPRPIRFPGLPKLIRCPRLPLACPGSMDLGHKPTQLPEANQRRNFHTSNQLKHDKTCRPEWRVRPDSPKAGPAKGRRRRELTPLAPSGTRHRVLHPARQLLPTSRIPTSALGQGGSPTAPADAELKGESHPTRPQRFESEWRRFHVCFCDSDVSFLATCLTSHT